MATFSSAHDPGTLGFDGLRGRTALVTGAGSGIGRAIALRLTELGATVIGLGRGEAPLAETWKLISARHCEGVYAWRTLDVRDRDAAAALVAELDHTGIDLLVNNAGGQYVAPAMEISPRGLDAVLDLNLTAIAHLIEAARPALARAAGTVVTISLSSPERGMPGIAHAAAARAAIIGLTEELAYEWAADGIALHCLAPGTVLTDELAEELTPETLARRLAGTPLQHDTDVAEVAEWVAALATGAGGLVSGTVLQLDGGAGIHGVSALSLGPARATAGVAPTGLVQIPFTTGGHLRQAASGVLAAGIASAFVAAQQAVAQLPVGGTLLFVVSGEAAHSAPALRAITSLTRTLALEWAPQRRVNAVVCEHPSDAEALSELLGSRAGRPLTGGVFMVQGAHPAGLLGQPRPRPSTDGPLRRHGHRH